MHPVVRILASLALASGLAAAQAQSQPAPPSPAPAPATPTPAIPGLQELGKLVPPAVRDALKGGQDATKGNAGDAKAPPAPPTGRDAPRGADGLLAVPPAAQITDLAGVLSPADQQQLKAKLDAVETAHGAQIVILVVPSTKPEPIEDFANRVGAAWKVGRRGVGDGVLVIAAIDDRRVRIDVARALEGAIPDITARRIIREALAPRFQQRDSAGGLIAAVDLLARQIEGEGLPTPAGVPQGKVDAGEGVFALLVPFVIFGIMVGALLRRILGGPGALMAGGGSGVLAGAMLQSIFLGGLAGLLVFIFALGAGSRSARALGGRRAGRGGWSGPVIIPGGGWSGGGGGGWSSGGGGDFSGGGASGDW
ncbi:MAG: TPM domain-containing protein [Betaproteobacteria bacterium]